MKHSFAAATALLAAGLAFAGCTGGGNGSSSTLFGTILAPTFQTSAQADLTGQQSVYQGPLGNGEPFTFPAIQGVTYFFTVTTNNTDRLILDIFSTDGSEIDSKTIDPANGGGAVYVHKVVSQHVLCVLRPYDPLATIDINSITVLGTGNFDKSKLQINIIVAGDDFTGFGSYNDLASISDRQSLAADLAARVQALHDNNNTGIKISFEGFSLTTAQVKATHPELVDSTGHTICPTQAESVNQQGAGIIDTGGLDKWGDFGFPSNATNAAAANGLDVFIVHHFATDGVVGLSPRPGNALVGNGAGTSLCVGAFLQAGGTIQGPRDLPNMGVVLTHEIGHFLGLQHTTTFSPGAAVSQVNQAIDDGLADTAAAGNLATLKANATANGHSSIGAGDGCADEPLIMFYQSEPTQQTFSPSQVKIMQTTLSSMQH